MPFPCGSPSEGRPPVLLFSVLVITLSLAGLGCTSSGPLGEGQCPDASTASAPAAGVAAPDAHTVVEVGLEVSEITLSISGDVVQFAIPESGRARLTLHNSRGQQIERILSTCLEEGIHRARPRVKGLAPGVYSVRLQFNGQVRTRMLRVAPA